MIRAFSFVFKLWIKLLTTSKSYGKITGHLKIDFFIKRPA